MPEPLSQRDARWRDIKLGFSDYTIGTHGCTITAIAYILETTPDRVNEKLKAVEGFQGALVIWAKLADAFPQIISATRHWIYDNEIVSNNLPCLVEVNGSRIGAGKHWVAYQGDQKMMDPWFGTVKGTSYYPATGMTTLKIDKSYKEEDEKVYTEAQMTSVREERDKNWNSFQAEIKAHNLTKKNHSNFVEELSTMYGSVASEESVIKFATENSRVIDERNTYKDKWEREVELRKKEYDLHQKELAKFSSELEKIKEELRLEKEKNTQRIENIASQVNSAIEKSDAAKEAVLNDQKNPTETQALIILTGLARLLISPLEWIKSKIMKGRDEDKT